MSKDQSAPMGEEDVDLDAPPSYTESLSPAPTGDAGFPTSHLLNPLSAHLQNLPAYIRQTQAITQNTRADRDLQILDFILPHVGKFLLSKDIATAPSGLTELVLVPKAAVDARWALSGVTERRREGDVVRVGRVDIIKQKGEKGEKGRDRRRESDDSEEDERGGPSTSNAEFSEWGRWHDDTEKQVDSVEAYWWRDEAMARRLAAYLQPKEHVKTERKEVQAEVEQRRKEKGLFSWGRKKSDAKTVSPSPLPASPGPQSPIERLAGERHDRVSMKVRAEEVTFRRENDMGVWESTNGFAVVVRVTVKKA